jgi:signal transduction histidine kinase
MRRLAHFAPKTLRGQITFTIVLALVTVIVGGRWLEDWAKRDYEIVDTSHLAERINTVAGLLRVASPGERSAILLNARRSGLEVSLEPTSITSRFKHSSSSGTIVGALVEKLFPNDGVYPPPLGGWRTYLDNHRILAARVDDNFILVYTGISDSIFASSIVGEGSHYLVAVVVLIGSLSIFAIWAITEPIRRISSAANDSDITNSSQIFEERGSLEIVALARALNGMRSRIRLMVESRTRMLRGIGHDVRTPLTRLRLRTERMEESPLREALLTDILRIDSLLADSLSYLRDEYATEVFERADIASILQSVCSEFSDVGMDVVYDGPNKVIVNCKPLAMTRVITNLCDNGIKFGKAVNVSLKEDRTRFVILVSDDGPGISAEMKTRVFEPFFKVDAARGQGNTGFGLGLSIVADIVHAHQGQIELDDGQPHGLIARISIPCNLTARGSRNDKN